MAANGRNWLEHEGMSRLKAEFPTASPTDYVRFLAAADGVLEGRNGAIATFAKHQEWLKSLPSMDAMYTDCQVEFKKCKFYERGTDKSKNMICWWQTSNNDPKVRDLQTMQNAMIYLTLALKPKYDATVARGEEAGVSLVVDRTNNTLDLPFVANAIPMLQENFPEMLGFDLGHICYTRHLESTQAFLPTAPRLTYALSVHHSALSRTKLRLGRGTVTRTTLWTLPCVAMN